MTNEWFYQLLGRDLGVSGVVSIADVLTAHSGDSIIYRGVVSEFEIAEAGTLKLLTLTDAKRGKGRGAAFTWTAIPGNRLILLGGCLHSINITHLVLEPVSNSFWQRFVNEDM
jgi:hypothetical protein